MKSKLWMAAAAAVFLLGGCSLAFGQESGDTSTAAPPPPEVTTHNNVITSLASQFFEGDFINYFAFFNGVYDTAQQTSQGRNGGGGGFSVGGGVTASRHFSDSSISLSYRGEYRNYSGGFQGSGTNQYLSLIYSKQLSRRWTLTLDEAAGILFYNNAFYNTTTSSGGVQTNPFSPSTRFLSSSAFVSYQQTQRLKYILGGSFFLNRYSYAGSIGSTGGIFTASAVYQLTARTSVGGTYSHDNFVFQHGAGNTGIDGGYANVNHIFGRNWTVYFSAGVTSARTSGTINIPVEIIIPGGQIVPGYAVSHYKDNSLVPTFQGGVSRRISKFYLTATAGHGVNPGNGTYLTSSHTYFGGAVSRAFGRTAVLSGNLSYSRVTSIANQVAQSYTQTFTTVSYSRIIIPHLSAYVAYNYDRYGSLLTYGARSDNRFIAGVAFSSKNIPLTAY